MNAADNLKQQMAKHKSSQLHAILPLGWFFIFKSVFV